MSARCLRIGVLVSATGANLSTLLRLQAAEPELLQVALVAAHGPRVPALEVARRAGVEYWPGDFDACCGLVSSAHTSEQRSAYRAKARAWHDRLDGRLCEWERVRGALDLIVLAYQRWIEGNLLARFEGRMVNQHPGDLSRLGGDGRRMLTGRDPVLAALRAGHASTRTSTFLVDDTHDGGAVVCLGPEVSTAGRRPTRADADAQELVMKRESDPACLEWTVRAFAAGRLALSGQRHPDGSPVVLIDDAATALGGMRL